MPDLTPEQIAELRWSADRAQAGGSQFEFQCLATPGAVFSLLDELERLRAAMPTDDERSEMGLLMVGHDRIYRGVTEWLSRIDAARRGPGR